MHTRLKLLHISISIPVAVRPFPPSTLSKDTSFIQKPLGNLFLWLLVRRNVSFTVAPLIEPFEPNRSAKPGTRERYWPRPHPQPDGGSEKRIFTYFASTAGVWICQQAELPNGGASQNAIACCLPMYITILLDDSTQATVVSITFHFSLFSQGRSHPIYLTDQ